MRQQWDAAVAELLDLPEFAERAGEAKSYDAIDRQTMLSWVRMQLGTLRLSQAEACAVCDANNGALWLEHSWAGIWANVADSDCLGEKWEVDCSALIAKLRNAGPVVQFALSWAICQFWRRCDEDTDRVLIDLGFVAGAVHE